MIKAPKPLDETERLAALHALNILDTSAEERFDRITRVASRMFDVPIAYVAMVDADRQWFKSTCGWAATQTPRDVSFCGHAILQKQPLIIPDALTDPRFADNPMVKNTPFVRFYAGHPVATEGHNVGTLCLVDRKPRSMGDKDLTLFHELAAMVEHEITLVDLIGAQRELISAKEEVLKNREHLARELSEAAEYVRSLLPAPMNDDIRSAWEFIPSAQLGGDFFCYNWIDDDHFAMYLIDVCGHGVGAALLSITVSNILRSMSLPNTDFRNPAHVLTRLNESFQMDEFGRKYFTMWYGVYQKIRHRITYASGGHPPALLLTGDDPGRIVPKPLRTDGLVIGGLPGTDFANGICDLKAVNRLYLYSDGTYEVSRPDRVMMELGEYMRLLASMDVRADDDVQRILQAIRDWQGRDALADDFSLLRVDFPGVQR